MLFLAYRCRARTAVIKWTQGMLSMAIHQALRALWVSKVLKFHGQSPLRIARPPKGMRSLRRESRAMKGRAPQAASSGAELISFSRSPFAKLIRLLWSTVSRSRSYNRLEELIILCLAMWWPQRAFSSLECGSPCILTSLGYWTTIT